MTEKKIGSDVFLAFVSDKETLEVVESFSVSRYGLQLQAQQSTIKAAISHLQLNGSPRVLLIDISDSDFPVSDMKAVADVCEPGVQVIAIGNVNDVGVYRDLLDIGVKDYIAKPLNVRLLVRSLDNLFGLDGSNKDAKFTHAGKLVSFVGARGGVGSSTIAANCAWILAHGHYKRVGMLDLDFHSGVMNQIFNIDSSTMLEDLLRTPDRIDEAMLMRSAAKVSDYLSTLSAPVPLDERFPFPTEAVSSCLHHLMNHFHYTVLDFPRYNHEQHFSILAQSDVIVVTLEMSLFCVREVVSLLRLLKSTQDVQLIVVANKHNAYKKGELDKKVLEESLGHDIDLVIPFDNLCPLQKLNEGAPVSSEKGLLSEGLYELVTQITGKEAKTSPHTKSLLGGLFGGSK